MQFEQPQKKHTLNQKQIKIPDIEKNLVKTYSSSEKLFDPSTSPPKTDFMKRLVERQLYYSKFENLPKFNNA
jgi:hypothetical protein